MISKKIIPVITHDKLFILEVLAFLYAITLSKCILIGEYPYLKQLNNKKYILISNVGITFLDPTLTYSSNDVIFEQNAYSTPYDTYSTSAVQFPKEDGSLILAMVKDILYIFDQNETLLFNQSIISNYNSNINLKKPYYFYPYKRIGDSFITIFLHLIDYGTINVYLNFQTISYDYNSNEISFSEIITYDLETLTEETIPLEKKASIGCGLLKYNDNDIINLLFGTLDYVQIINFYPEKNFSAEQPLFKNTTKDYYRFFYKTIVLPGKEQAIHCSFSSYSYECIKYDIKTNSFTNFQNFTVPFQFVYEMTCTAIFFEETGEVLFTLLGFLPQTNINLILFICDLEGNYRKVNISSIGDVDLLNIKMRNNLVIPLDKLTYHIYIYKSDIENYALDLGIEFNLTCKFYYNYPKTSCLENIPNGFYCNSTNDKTLDKCHENCKTCSEGSNESNNNCLSCIDNFYYDLGNCRSTCLNGYFIDEIHNLTCKCTNNIKCFYCNENDLCTKCNTEEGYFPKNEEETNTGYINCYKDPEGYYLLNDEYYPCYSTCNKCTEQGNDINNKCTQCKEDYIFISNLENNNNNCYKRCPYYYYFDENNKYHCTDKEECPSEYNKLISEKGECIKSNEVMIITTFTENNTNSTECSIEDFIKDKCNLTISNQGIINNLRDYILDNNIEDLLWDYSNQGNILTKRMDDMILQITHLEKQPIHSNNSIIDLGECENILKNIYGLENNSIILYKIDIPISGYSTFDVEYELYNPLNNSKLNLEYCNQKTIDVHIPALIDSSKIHKYDPKSDYYNDLCFPYTNENESDVIILDRKNEFINNNLTLCDNDCEFKRYDSINKKAICECSIKFYRRNYQKLMILIQKSFLKTG